MTQTPCNRNFWQSPTQTRIVQQPSELPWGQQSLCCYCPSMCMLWSNSYCPLTPTKPRPLWPRWTSEQAESHPTMGEEGDKTWARGTLKVAGNNHHIHYRPRTATSGEKCTSLQSTPAESTPMNAGEGIGGFRCCDRLYTHEWDAGDGSNKHWTMLCLPLLVRSVMSSELPFHLQLRLRGNLGFLESLASLKFPENKLLQSLAFPSIAHVPLNEAQSGLGLHKCPEILYQVPTLRHFKMSLFFTKTAHQPLQCLKFKIQHFQMLLPNIFMAATKRILFSYLKTLNFGECAYAERLRGARGINHSKLLL